MLLKHEEKLTSIMNDIRDIKESGKTDNKVTRDKFNVLSQMLQEIEHKMDDMEERRNNARRETLKQQLFNLYYKYKERAEATGEMVLSQCEYEQFWTAFHESEWGWIDPQRRGSIHEGVYFGRLKQGSWEFNLLNSLFF